MNDKNITISVRGMVEFILRSGSIDSSYTGAISMQDGTRIHQKLQKQRVKQALLNDFIYEKEYLLKYTTDVNGFIFELEGRADGVIRRDGYVCIEEIKSTLAQIDGLQRDESHWHWAQAKCYAFMLAVQENLAEIKIMLTYMHVETNETVSFEHTYLIDDIRAFVADLIEKYMKWAQMDYERKRRRNLSLKNLTFPYDSYRKGQREFAVSVYKTIQRNKNLFAQAPTGTGKTISALFPCVKAIGEGLAEKIFYLTAKTITRQTAQDAAKLMEQKGAEMLSITLTAKDKICPNPDCDCNPRECIYANGHFDRVNDALWDILNNSNGIKREDIQAFAEKHTVCPHEFSLDITEWADVIICDYNYVFDPKVKLKRFFSDEHPKENYLFLIDEAHNLVDRSREMYSKTIYKSSYLKLKKLFKTVDSQISKICGKINNYFVETRKVYFEDGSIAVASVKEPLDLLAFLRTFVDKTDIFLAKAQGESKEILDALVEEYFNAVDFLRISEFYGEEYTVFMENAGSDFSIKLLCLDASKILADIQKKAVASIFFSATLTPLWFFRDVLGGREGDYLLKMRSPFESDNLCLIIENQISTKYKERNLSYKKIAECLNKMVLGKRGNYFAFFPSYDYLLKVHEIFAQSCGDTDVLLQTQGMSEDEREGFLANFYTARETSMLAFAVMGGIFSEGIDLKHDALIGAAIVGVGLPLINPERNIISDYYESAPENPSSGRGFEYAYMYPGMNKVLQSAGRVIRTETDKGVVILIDDRFASSRYLDLFPPEWTHYKKTSNTADLQIYLEKFWGARSNK